MDFFKNKKLIALLIILGILILFLLGFYLFGNSGSEEKVSENIKTEEEIVYPNITDSEKVILSKVYNKNASSYATGFRTLGDNIENIFGNEQELLADNLSQETKMSIALYNILENIDGLDTISCKNITWNRSWNDKCGGAGNNLAYQIPVLDLNAKVVEIFNKDLDYGSLNTSDLTIGNCQGNNIYSFRYIADLGIYVSVIGDKCPSSRLEVTKLEKSEANDTLTLDVYYTLYINNKETDKRHDKLYFKIKEDGTYYFYSSAMIEKNRK